jgi:hypothetical protein
VRAEAPAEARARWIVLAAAPLHAALAIGTDLSPDEAYYLCAAREEGFLPPIVDHPPLLPWLLRLVDQLEFLPLELRVRLVPIACSLVLGLLCVELARQRGGGRAGCAFAAWVGSFAILPTTAGFVATPDGPALIAIAAGLFWAAQSEEAGSLKQALGMGSLLALGALAKVIVIPAAVLLAALAGRRPARDRAALLAPMLLVAPLLLPSLVFQLNHAFLEPRRAWSLVGAALALGEAAFVQVLLWSPGVVVWGACAARRLPLPDQGMIASISALIALSALVRATPPEANWWAPSAVVLLAGAAVTAERRSSRARAAVIATVLLPTLIASIHSLRPFLPLPPHADPTARLHGWSEGRAPLDAAGVGPYGPAAERCVYRDDCTEIRLYFDEMTRSTSRRF